MTAFILESGICMAVSLLFYFVLFAKAKHLQFNRFYLLFTVLLSLLIPFLHIETSLSYPVLDDAHFNMVEGFAIGGDTGKVTTPPSMQGEDSAFHFGIALLCFYGFGVLCMLYRYLKNLLMLRTLILRSERIDRGSYKIVLMKGTMGPFTFMNHVFVNRDEYRQCHIHEAIWTHELTHVRLYHSIDILAIELSLVFLYFNPLLWLYRYAIKLNHEYAADEIALASHPDVEQYAYQLIRSIRAESNLLLECSFNYSSTKKRLIMLTRTKNGNVLFGNKIVLAALFVLATAMMLSFQPIRNPAMSAEETRNVVIIDLGHGGNDVGAKSPDGMVSEVEIVNSIGKLIREMDTRNRFVFTRGDQNVSLHDRVEMAAAEKAGLLLSVHVGVSDDKRASGIEVFYSASNIAARDAKNIGEVFADKMVFRKDGVPAKVKTADFKILKESQCPAVLITLGFISNELDLKYLMSEQNQRDMAKQIVSIIDESR